MVTYYNQPCDSIAEWAVQYNATPQAAFYEITSGESVSSGNSLRSYCASGSFAGILTITDNISVLVPPESGLYQYRLDFWMKFKSKTNGGGYFSNLSYPAVWVQTNQGRAIGGVGIYSSGADACTLIALYGNVGSTGRPNLLFGATKAVTIAMDVWTHFEVVITPQYQDVYMDGVFQFRDTSSRPNLAPSQIAVSNGSSAAVPASDVLFDEININSLATQFFTLTVAPTTNGTVDGNYPPGTYPNLPVGSNITITATPAVGYRLAGWVYNGSTATTNPLQFQLNKDTTVQAVFELDVTPPTAPVASFAITSVTDLTACFDAASSHVTASGATITGYAWDFGDGYTGSGVNLCHTYANAGTYNVTLTVVDSNSLSNSITHSVTVTAPPTPTPPVANFTPTPTGLTVSFNGASSYATTAGATITAYDWNFGDGSTGVGQIVSHTYGAAGTYNALLTVTDSNSLTGSVSKSVTVTEGGEPTPPIADFTSTPTALAVPFDASGSHVTTTGATIVSYAWDFGDGQYGTGQTITHVYAQEGTYTVKLAITDSNSLTAEMTQTVTVSPQLAGFPWWIVLALGGSTVVGAVVFSGKGKKKKARKGKRGKPAKKRKGKRRR